MCCTTITVSHTEQCMPSVNPSVLQVGEMASSITSVWSSFAISVCGTVIVLQTEHFLPSVSPVLMQVAPTAGIVTSV